MKRSIKIVVALSFLTAGFATAQTDTANRSIPNPVNSSTSPTYQNNSGNTNQRYQNNSQGIQNNTGTMQQDTGRYRRQHNEDGQTYSKNNSGTMHRDSSSYHSRTGTQNSHAEKKHAVKSTHRHTHTSDADSLRSKKYRDKQDDIK